MIRCDKCGEYNGDTRETCFKCGESLNNPQNIEQRKMCTICGEVVRTTEHRCPHCGGLLQRFDGTDAEAEVIRAQKQYEISKPDFSAAMQSPAASAKALGRAVKRRQPKEIALYIGLTLVALIIAGFFLVWILQDGVESYFDLSRLLRWFSGLFS